MDEYIKHKREEYSLYAGIGSEVFIIPKIDDAFDKDKHSLKDGWEKYAVRLDVSDKKDAVTSCFLFENDGTAALKMRSCYSFSADLMDTLHSACELTRCVLPYRSTIPFAVRYTYPSYRDPNAMELKKPWCYYHLPEIQAHFVTYGSGEVVVWFLMKGRDIGIMSYQEYRNCLSYEKWKEDSLPVNSSRYRLPYP